MLFETVFAVWVILYFGKNMNQFEMEKLKRSNMENLC